MNCAKCPHGFPFKSWAFNLPFDFYYFRSLLCFSLAKQINCHLFSDGINCRIYIETQYSGQSGPAYRLAKTAQSFGGNTFLEIILRNLCFVVSPLAGAGFRAQNP